LAGSEADAEGDRTRVVRVGGPEGALSLELSHVDSGTTRAFMKQSPRSLALSQDRARELDDGLRSTGYRRFYAADNKRRLLQRSLLPLGWRASRSVQTSVDHKCSICATHDLPLDENLVDDTGSHVDLSDTSHMVGVSIDLGGRRSWGFFTDDGDTARIVSEGKRRQGMLVALSTEDMERGVACLLRFLAASKKRWAVFSTSMGRFVRDFNPVTMWRMELQRPKGYDHSVSPYGRDSKKSLVRLFSEYYDEGYLAASLRLRQMAGDRNTSIFTAEKGFAIARLEGEAGLIYDIYVTPSSQGAGMGRELMRGVLSHFSGRANSVYLHTSYPRAKRMYESFGFKGVYSQLAVRLDELVFEPPST